MAGRRKSRRRAGRGVQRGNSSVYQFTPKRKIALKRAQAISARKRSALSSHVKEHRAKYIVASAAAITAGGIVARHKLSGSKFGHATSANVSAVTGKRLASGVQGSILSGDSKGARITIKANHPRNQELSHRSVFTYEHKKLNINDVLGEKISTRIRGLKDRGFSSNPAAPGYRAAANTNYGSHGPRLSNDGPRKYYGNYEMFSNMGHYDQEGKWHPRTHVVDIGQAMGIQPKAKSRKFNYNPRPTRID